MSGALATGHPLARQFPSALDYSSRSEITLADTEINASRSQAVLFSLAMVRRVRRDLKKPMRVDKKHRCDV
jgi:hypothetical protein